MPPHEHKIAADDFTAVALCGAEIRAAGAREAPKRPVREADRAEAEAWSIRMEGYGSKRVLLRLASQGL
jgi:hypothetical protein